MSKAGAWFRGLSNSGKVAVVSVATLLTIGTVGTLAQSGSDSPNTPPASSAAPAPVPEPKPASAPVVTTELKKEVVGYTEEKREDSSLAKGQTKTVQEGADGERTITFEVTTLDGKETSRKELKNEITKAPINKITRVGTYVAPAPAPKPKSNCDPNYSGACVPVASDVDCAGGSGNGPAYVSGPVTVIGTDIYDLDRDGNGTGCES